MRTDPHKLDSTGISIAAPKLIEPKPSLAVDAVLSIVLILLGVFGAAWCFISTFSLPVLQLTVLLYTLLFIAVFTLTLYLKSARYPILFVLALLYAAVIWYCRTAFVQGFIITTNQIMATYANHTDYVLPIYVVAATPAQFQSLCTIFVLFVIFFITCFVSWAVIKQKSFWLTFLVTFPFLLAALIFTIMPNFIAVLMLILCWTSLILMRLPAERKKGVVKTHGTYCVKSNAAAARSGLMPIPAVILCFLLIMMAFPQQSYQRSEQVDQLRENLTDAVTGNTLFGGDKALSGNVNHVDLKNQGDIQFTGKTAMKIKSDKQYPLYLKSFSGSVYTESSWEKLPDSDYIDINQKLNGMNVQNMSQAFLLLVGEQNSANPFKLQVKNISAAKLCIYTPYNLATTPKDITGVKFVNDAFIRSGSPFGVDEYSLYAYGLQEGQIESNIAGMVLNVISNKVFPLSDTKKFTDMVNDYLASQNQFSSLDFSNLEAYYKSTVPEKLTHTLDDSQRKFIETEQNYRLFMYDKYTQLPQNTKKKVQSLLKQEGLMEFPDTNAGLRTAIKPFGSILQITNAVKRYLSQDYYYTLSPGKVPKGKNFTDYFLFESHKGYCVHFATAATVMLRAMGVPARYAEGYVVTADDYKTAGSDGWASIRDSRAHAWVEIYYPGLGWQPVEVTPGFNVEKNLTQDNNPKNEPPVSSGAASSAPEVSEPESQIQSKPQSNAVTSQSSAPTGTASNSDFNAAAVTLLLTMAAILLLLVAAALKRRIECSRRIKLFGLRDTNKAVLCVYAYIANLTKFGGEISAEVSDIALKARFSQHVITPRELKTMTDFAQKLALQNYERLSKGKRLVFKYIYDLI